MQLIHFSRAGGPGYRGCKARCAGSPACLRRQGGFSMLEVMVSLLITLFGVLGMVGLHSMAVKNTELGRYSGRAAIDAASMAAAMRANVAYWGAPATAITVQGTGTINGITMTGGPTGGGSCVPTSLAPVASTCTGAQLAYSDLVTWGTDVANALPAGNMAIACNIAVSPVVCTITISWSEKTLALHNPTGTETGALASGTAQTHSYQTLVSVI